MALSSRNAISVTEKKETIDRYSLGRNGKTSHIASSKRGTFNKNFNHQFIGVMDHMTFIYFLSACIPESIIKNIEPPPCILSQDRRSSRATAQLPMGTMMTFAKSMSRARRGTTGGGTKSNEWQELGEAFALNTTKCAIELETAKLVELGFNPMDKKSVIHSDQHIYCIFYAIALGYRSIPISTSDRSPHSVSHIITCQDVISFLRSMCASHHHIRPLPLPIPIPIPLPLFIPQPPDLHLTDNRLLTYRFFLNIKVQNQ